MTWRDWESENLWERCVSVYIELCKIFEFNAGETLYWLFFNAVTSNGN